MATCKCKSVCVFSGSQRHDLDVVSFMLSDDVQEHDFHFVGNCTFDILYRSNDMQINLHGVPSCWQQIEHTTNDKKKQTYISSV